MTRGSYAALIRPMTERDIATCEAISAAAFLALDRATYPRSWPEPSHRSADHAASWRRRTEHVLSTDPEGCWVGEVEGEVVGFATSIVRELMWILCSYAVSPGWQGHGLGTQLFDATAAHGRGCLRGMFNASQHQSALRLYRQAGFDLHPQFLLWGEVDRCLLPAGIAHVREGSADDFDLMDSIDRRTRGSAHGRDHELLSTLARLIVLDRASGSGYAYCSPTGDVLALAATSRRAAMALCFEAIAASRPDTPVQLGRLTAANAWALDVAMAVRLQIHPRGFLAVKHQHAPTPYLPHGTLL